MGILPVHECKEAPEALFTNGCPNGLSDGGVWGFKDIAPPSLVRAESGVNTRRLEQVGVRRMTDIVEQSGELNEFFVVF